jgi:hypothetical protein
MTAVPDADLETSEAYTVAIQNRDTDDAIDPQISIDGANQAVTTTIPNYDTVGVGLVAPFPAASVSEDVNGVLLFPAAYRLLP